MVNRYHLFTLEFWLWGGGLVIWCIDESEFLKKYGS